MIDREGNVMNDWTGLVDRRVEAAESGIVTARKGAIVETGVPWAAKTSAASEKIVICAANPGT